MAKLLKSLVSSLSLSSKSSSEYFLFFCSCLKAAQSPARGKLSSAEKSEIFKDHYLILYPFKLSSFFTGYYSLTRIHVFFEVKLHELHDSYVRSSISGLNACNAYPR